ncbi:MAG: hypothetical protein UY05_C0006G0007 [Candidatus Peregrinibacteria bacterium GW2011_GWA2_47_7]|nr:MAG: hypothetical protein UY05_C0006G0007 [Candidatus Peregrinibacteria bacterium GW2011_GWA2_47_7]
MNEVNIDNTNKNFNGQLAQENLLCFCRKHWIVLVPYLCGATVVVASLGLFAFGVSQETLSSLFSRASYHAVMFGVVLAVTYYLHRFFIRFFNYYLQIFIITNYRVIDLDKSIFLRDSRDALDLSKIQDCVMHQRGILQSLLNYGEIHIMLSASVTEKVLTYMPNPDYHFKKINKAKRAYAFRDRPEGFETALSERVHGSAHAEVATIEKNDFVEISPVNTAPK